jgi:superfamily I DNA/RNA helicase
MITHDLTPQQEAAIAAAADAGNLQIIARAGCGKTSTICEMAKVVGPSIAVAFNVRAKDDLVSKLPATSTAKTLNSLGAGAVYRGMGRKLLDADKMFKLAKEMKLGEDLAPALLLAQKARLRGLVVPFGQPKALDDSTWSDVAEDNDISEEIIPAAQDLLFRSVHAAFSGTIDFDDQLYLPIIYSLPITPAETIFVDEAQDLNGLQHRLVCRSGRRVISVGDPAQSIYQWRGALEDSMAALAMATAARELPLSVSFRCPKAIIAEAQKYVPDIVAAPWAKLGYVGQATISDVPSGGTILCRFNAPLIRAAFSLLKSGRPVKMIGRDISLIVRSYVRRQKLPAHASIDMLRRRLASELASASGAKLRKISDRIETIQAIIEYGSPATVGDLETILNRLFAERKDAIILSTIHRAKGLEWPVVYWLQKSPSWYDATEQAEQNCAYVAVTRAQERLYFIDGA